MGYNIFMNKKRDISIDVLRGWAVWWMIVAHVVFFRYGLESGYMNLFIHFGGSFCYITFLFTFGVGIYHSIVASTWDRPRKIKVIRRVVQLIALYFLAGIASYWSYIPLRDLNPTFMFESARQVVTFAYYPSFTEYLPSFAIFTLLFFGLRQLLKDRLKAWFNGRNFAFLMASAIAIHLLANVVSHNLTSYVHSLRMIIGTPTSFDFPIMQYFVVVVLGIWSATWISNEKSDPDRRIVLLGYLILLANMAIKYTFNFTHKYDFLDPWVNTIIRWPPSPTFILNGLSYTFLFWIATRWMLNVRWFNPLTSVLHYMGIRGIGLLIYHLIPLFALKSFGVPMNTIFEVAIFCIGIVISYWGLEGLVNYLVSRYNIRHEKAT